MPRHPSTSEGKMRRLVKGLDFEGTMDYYNYIVDSKRNGNFNQCKRLFNDMPVSYRKLFLLWLLDEIQSNPEPSIYAELAKLLIEEL